jgi:hypothetical protein
MRHRIGIILAVVMSGVVFFAGAWGYLRLLRLPAPEGQLSQLPAHGGSLLSDHSVVAALAAIAITGLLAGILIGVPRISPLAAGLPGLVLLGWTALYLVSVRRAVDLIPLRSEAFGAGFEAMLFNGILASAGLAMIIPLFLPSRWRVHDEAVEPADESEYVSSWAETAESPAPPPLPERVAAYRTARAASVPPWPIDDPMPAGQPEPTG